MLMFLVIFAFETWCVLVHLISQIGLPYKMPSVGGLTTEMYFLIVPEAGKSKVTVPVLAASVRTLFPLVYGLLPTVSSPGSKAQGISD